MLFALSNIGLPGTAGFVGEFMVIMSALQNTIWIGVLSALTIVLSAVYLLNMYRQVFFGEPDGEIMALHDISWKETGVLSILALVILVIGIYPSFLVDILTPSVSKLVSASLVSKIGVV